MKRPENYDIVQAVGEFEPLELGGHICVIVQAEEIITRSNKNALKLYLDIAEGRQKGYFQKLYDMDERQPKKWGCTYIQLAEGASVGYFKALITAIEKSNQGYIWNWNENTLKGKLVGGVFGREQYKNNKNELKFATKCITIRSIYAIIDGIEAPPDKLFYDTNDDMFVPIYESDIPF